MRWVICVQLRYRSRANYIPVGYDSLAAYVMYQQCYKVIRKSHTVVAGYITPPKRWKPFGLRSNIKFKTTEAIFFKAIELHHSFVAIFYCPKSDIKASSLKASSALGYLCSLYNIPDRLVSSSPKLISLAIIKGLVLSTTKRQNRILNFVHFSLLMLSTIGYMWDMQIKINQNKSKIKQDNGI